MICPNCKKEMGEGKLYCENCGEEIKFVPEFEPEFEKEISDTLTGMILEMEAEKVKEAEQVDMAISAFMEDDRVISRFFFHFLRKKILYVFIFFVIMALGIAGIWAYSIRTHTNTFEYQYGQALVSEAQGNYLEAITFMKKALTIESTDQQAKLKLAEYYIIVKKYDEAIVILKELITVEETKTDAYGALVKLYVKREDYSTIHHLLENCDDEQIQEKYKEYMAKVPSFNYGEGTYQNVIALKISSNTEGIIYYTMDGSDPTNGSHIYSSPLFLENGVYVISAVFKNSYGIESEVVTRTYTIDTTVPYPPEVKVYSGNYEKPKLISVEVPEDSEVYYTYDGSEPNINGILYTKPIPMFLGTVTLKFVTKNSQGVFSKTTQRTYSLNMLGNISKPDAVNMLVMKLTEQGYLLDYNGYLEGKSGRNAYLITSGITIDSKDYYLIDEYYEDVDGTMSKTNIVYAVDILTGDLYNMIIDTKEVYTLTPLD